MNDTHTCSSDQCSHEEGSEKKCCGGNCSAEGSCAHSQDCKEGSCSCCQDEGGEAKCCSAE